MTNPKPTSRNRSKIPRKNKGSQETRTLLMVGGIAVALLAVLFVIGRLSQTAQVVDTSSLVYEDSPTLGPVDAPVTIVEFLDPECESCRAMFPVVKDIMQKYEGRVRLVVRYLPLHSNSVLAAAVTEAAGAQGKYWEMQELLFTRQTEWGEKPTPQTNLFLQYASELDLDMEQFQADLNKPEYQQKIARDKADAEALGLRGTPSFFVNGKPMRQLSPEGLTAAIEAALP